MACCVEKGCAYVLPAMCAMLPFLFDISWIYSLLREILFATPSDGSAMTSSSQLVLHLLRLVA